ncbi:MAG TPA: bifunctional acetate--CoA ligase family protein/GNAT family N-acetyltransferase [Thermodesulfovibrionales bacterium]|nr:bifunctional acetate--CoA ligase family protein/GNAT family N-acetyltransferase [Thermodesulfovibrionales bacterium]
MSIKNLEVFFNPKRIAVVGASQDPESTGYFILKNMIGNGFSGVVHPVNPLSESVQGVEAYKTLSSIPHSVDLAILAVPFEEILPTVEECGKKNVKGVSIIYPDFCLSDKENQLFSGKIKKLLTRYDLRILGPNTLGFIRPSISLNASLFPKMPKSGTTAFISQSATLTSALLDRAIDKNFGFSYIISLGTRLDLGFPDLIDFLGVDPKTRAIILYLEHIERGRKFMTAVRSFARSKPIVVVKSGKFDISAQAALTHSGVLAGEDKIYDAVFKRAGAVRIDEILDLFYLAETLAQEKRPRGKRLAIITNAGAPSMIAMDTLLKLEGELSVLGEDTVGNLRQLLPSVREVQNPVNLLTSASPADYKTAVENCLKDANVDGLVVIHVPNFRAQPEETAGAIVAAKQVNPHVPLFTVWMGGELVQSARELLNERAIPTFVTPEQAVRSFIYLYRYDYNLQLLQETPETILRDFSPDREIAKNIIDGALDQERVILNSKEVKEILQAYGMPVITTKRAENEEEVVRISEEIGYPVVLKIDSEKVFHKIEKSGVHLNLKDEGSVRDAFRSLRELALSSGDPEAHVLIQPMITQYGYELAIGAKKDPAFGSVIVFGMGGELLATLGDYAVGLPPLNQTLARRLMEETKIYKFLLSQDRHKETLRLLEEMLVRFSYLLIDFPSIKEIDINPFFITDKEGFILDAGILLEREAAHDLTNFKSDLCPPHLCICPYPFKYVQKTTLENGVPAIIRPIRPEDEPLLYSLFRTLSEETIVFRFNQRLTDMPHERLARYCQLDYERELAFVALIEEGPGQEQMIADVRMMKMPDLETAELAILVADEWQGHGIGTMLIDYCIRIARELGIRKILMEILRTNTRMLHVARISGFEEVFSDEDMVRVVLDVEGPADKYALPALAHQDR